MPGYKRKPARAKKEAIKEEFRQEFLGIFLFALALFISFCIWKGNDAGNTHLIGVVGNFINDVLKSFCGTGKLLVPALLFFIGLSKLTNKIKFDHLSFYSALALFSSVLALLHIDLTLAGKSFDAGWEGLGGGIIGALMSYLSVALLGRLGSYIFWGVLIVAATVGLVKKTLADLFRQFFAFVKNFFTRTREELVDFLYEELSEEQEEREQEPQSPSFKKKRKNDLLIIDQTQSEAEKEDNLPGEMAQSPALLNSPQQDAQNKATAPQEKDNPDSAADSSPLIINDSCTPEEYKLPPLSILKRPPKVKSLRLNKDITDNVNILEETLESFGVKARVTQVSKGPSITRYELQPPAGVKVSRIVNLADDIALSLAAPQVRIEAPIPGKAAIGIEVPNPEIAVVSLREVLETPLFKDSPAKLTVALGKDIAGNPIMADLAKMPHLLIAGSTGSGKSVCMNALIASILYKAHPNEVKMMMIDPKVVELSTFNGIPHLVSPVVTDPKKAATALRWAIREMETRYELFAGTGVKDIQRYNQIMAQNAGDEFMPLPYIVIFIDELADLMMVAPADVEDAICRLAQMARAAGLHLVIATQRPSVDVITGVIKANIPSRIAFAVSSQTDSRTILDMGGAEHLLGRGDMLFYPTGMAKPIRVQGVYISEQEIDALVEFLKAQNSPVCEEEPWENEIIETVEERTEEDPLLAEAAKLFIESGQASISLLQRRMRIGYNRAARIIDQLEEKGIIGGYEGSKPRAVKMTWQEYEKTFGI